MDELVFDQRRSPDTLTNALRLLLAEWLTLSAPTRQRLEERRRQLRRELPTTAPLQRVGKVIDFLQELEADDELQPILGVTLRNGKGPRYRMLVQLGDEELRSLVEVLSLPSPEAQQAATPGDQLPFQLQLTVAEPATPGAPLPIIVSLSQDTRPPAQRLDSILVPFADLRQPVLLEVKLIAQG
nr:hypothetical protein [Caldilineaceae bacterium]